MAYVRTKFEGHSFIRLRNIGTFRRGALIDPVTLTFDLEVDVGVACDLMYPCEKFRLPRPFGFRVRADVRDIRQTPNFGPICGAWARTAHGLCACQI